MIFYNSTINDTFSLINIKRISFLIEGITRSTWCGYTKITCWGSVMPRKQDLFIRARNVERVIPLTPQRFDGDYKV